MGAMDGLIALPAHDAVPLPRRDAVALARAELRRCLTAESQPAETERKKVADGISFEARFVWCGDYWDVTYAGQTIRAKASKGMSDLARLLSTPGREIHCLDLAGATVEQASTGEMIDDLARRSYEQRLRDLQAEVEAAEADNDFVRAERAQTELDSIVEQLTTALGLGGRGRLQGSTAERARSTVTQRIRSTIRRLGAAHPALGRHLEASIVTGGYCIYRPEHPLIWQR
jgi:hypothetical protein